MQDETAHNNTVKIDKRLVVWAA